MQSSTSYAKTLKYYCAPVKAIFLFYGVFLYDWKASLNNNIILVTKLEYF